MHEPTPTRMTALAARGRAVTYDAKRAVLSRLLRAWDAAPALRLGQLLLVACKQQEPPLPLFAVEDERLADMVEAMAVVPEETPVTPSEVALAKVLAAWEAHRFCEDEGVSAARVIDRITDVLCECGMVDARGPGRRLDPEARALLDRARKAGVV